VYEHVVLDTASDGRRSNVPRQAEARAANSCKAQGLDIGHGG